MGYSAIELLALTIADEKESFEVTFLEMRHCHKDTIRRRDAAPMPHAGVLALQLTPMWRPAAELPFPTKATRGLKMLLKKTASNDDVVQQRVPILQGVDYSLHSRPRARL